MTSYESSGTSYSNFVVQAVPAGGTNDRIWSKQELDAETAKAQAVNRHVAGVSGMPVTRVATSASRSTAGETASRRRSSCREGAWIGSPRRPPSRPHASPDPATTLRLDAISEPRAFRRRAARRCPDGDVRLPSGHHPLRRRHQTKDRTRFWRRRMTARLPQPPSASDATAIRAARRDESRFHVRKVKMLKAWLRFALLLLAGIASLSVASAQDADQCSGNQLLAMPRAEGSCLIVHPQVYASPDQAVRAVVLPVGMDLHASPDIENRIVMRGSAATLLNSKDYASTRGTDGYYVVHAAWSPDSQFFAYSLSSSGGHSPWSFPIWVYGRAQNIFVSFSDLIEGRPTVSGEFSFSKAHILAATTVDKIGSDKQVPVTIDLAEAFKRSVPHSLDGAIESATQPCAKPSSIASTHADDAAEQTICQDYGLARTDTQVATLYRVVTSLVAMGQRSTLEDAQREWLTARDACRGDRVCLVKAYASRARELNAVLADIASRGPF